MRILAINPGSTSTKIAVFEDEENVFHENISHPAEYLEKYPAIQDQLLFRKEMIIKVLGKKGFPLESFHVFVGRGGGMVPCAGGVYKINKLLLEHSHRWTRHPSVLGAILVDEFAHINNVPAFIVDSPDTDELQDIARISGMKEFPRESRFHALNQKEVARRAAKSIDKTYQTVNLVVAHIGGGISVGAHREGKVIDVTDILNGDAPMAPTRAGQVPSKTWIEMCFSGNYTKKEMEDFVSKNGGVINHLGTSDMLEVERCIDAGDTYAKLVYDAMIYQIGKNIGAYATVLHGKVDAVVITGGMVRSPYLQNTLESMISYIAPVIMYPGEFEMEALAGGALRVMRGEEESLYYTGKPVHGGFVC
jgi:butyrate kinase